MHEATKALVEDEGAQALFATPTEFSVGGACFSGSGAELLEDEEQPRRVVSVNAEQRARRVVIVDFDDSPRGRFTARSGGSERLEFRLARPQRGFVGNSARLAMRARHVRE